MNAVVLESAVVEEQAMVAALSVVKPGTRIPSGTLAVGVPAVVKKRLAEDALQVSADGVATYRNLTRSYRNQRLDDIDTAI
jgi:carbonic anhydrase/acetyltransferase-like protein (isoleucine patch superfamily)